MIKRKVKYFEKKRIKRKIVNCPNQSYGVKCDGWSIVIDNNFKIGDIIEVVKDSHCGHGNVYNWREKKTCGQICSECLVDINWVNEKLWIL